ncbi:unnamed protein product [Dovyalis caffra]|uniref:Uncharacterized protein n=1 Tax=Dovyalis caffra TaxID=77055 RepID=A0AAV1SEK0_9ROSI|nr:unnamed protein product [Dovyalis caffra]
MGVHAVLDALNAEKQERGPCRFKHIYQAGEREGRGVGRSGTSISKTLSIGILCRSGKEGAS